MGKARTKSDHELVNLRINLEEAKNENAIILQELENTRNKLSDAEKLIQSQDKLVKDLEDRGTERVKLEAPSLEEVKDLKDRLRGLEAENARLQANYAKTDEAIASRMESGPSVEEASIPRDLPGS